MNRTIRTSMDACQSPPEGFANTLRPAGRSTLANGSEINEMYSKKVFEYLF